MAITNKEINLAQLDQETGGKGLVADFTDSDKKLILASENNNLTDEELVIAIAAHKAIDPNAGRIAAQAKLAALGLTTDDLEALGL
jgi:hypothetical protein